MRLLRGASAVVVIASVSFAAAGLIASAQAPEATSARTWLDQRDEIEQFIRDADVVGARDIGVGVTNPKRLDLAPGGPVDRVAFKAIRAGIYSGYWENYKSEIAAYELDKLLDLGMVPPTVEKRYSGDLGAAVMWVAPAQSFSDLGGPPTPPSTHIGRWNYQLSRAKMFHNLIYNKDPNLGNWMVDPAWNLILLDNSRAFTPRTTMVHELTSIDRDFWERFEALDETVLKSALGTWLSDREIRGILERRDQMAKEIDEMVAVRGESAVFFRYGGAR